MSKYNVPSAEDVRQYLNKEVQKKQANLDNHKKLVVTGPKFPGETIWSSKTTLPLLEAAKAVGTSNEEIWELCKKQHQLLMLQ